MFDDETLETWTNSKMKRTDRFKALIERKIIKLLKIMDFNNKNKH